MPKNDIIARLYNSKRLRIQTTMFWLFMIKRVSPQHAARSAVITAQKWSGIPLPTCQTELKCFGIISTVIYLKLEFQLRDSQPPDAGASD